jgi:hypothetical protein
MSDFAETIAINARETAIVARRRGEATLRIAEALPLRITGDALQSIERALVAGAPLFFQRERFPPLFAIDIGPVHAAPLLALARRAVFGEG